MIRSDQTRAADNVLHMVYGPDVLPDRFVPPNQRCHPCEMRHVRFIPQADCISLVRACGTHRHRKTTDEWSEERIVSYETLSRSSRHVADVIIGIKSCCKESLNSLHTRNMFSLSLYFLIKYNLRFKQYTIYNYQGARFFIQKIACFY